MTNKYFRKFLVRNVSYAQYFTLPDELSDNNNYFIGRYRCQQ